MKVGGEGEKSSFTSPGDSEANPVFIICVLIGKNLTHKMSRGKAHRNLVYCTGS